MPPPPAPGLRRAYRDLDNKILGGVAAGLAEHLRIPAIAVRVALLILLAANGLGALLYVIFWAVLPAAPRDPARRSRSRPDRRPRDPEARGRLTQAISLLALGAGLLLAAYESGKFGIATSAIVGLIALVALGAGIIWHQPSPAGVAAEATPTATVAAARARRWLVVRLVGGGLLVVLGVVGLLGLFAPGKPDLRSTATGLAFALLAVSGVLVVMAPLIWRMLSQLREERVARIREQERAEVAAIVHDQVLHTLALIQRRAAEPAVVLRLARGQERSLRHWLYQPAGTARERLAAALEQVAAEVEDTYGLTVETVVVGDAEYDEKMDAVVAATREALVNAGRHANVTTVSLYAEAEPDGVSIFVRDRGVGFDPSAVDGDRHGLRGSIIGRMRRHGGRAEIRSTVGEGTEIELRMPRVPAGRS